jgi:hypothetical protein
MSEGTGSRSRRRWSEAGRAREPTPGSSRYDSGKIGKGLAIQWVHIVEETEREAEDKLRKEGSSNIVPQACGNLGKRRKSAASIQD